MKIGFPASVETFVWHISNLVLIKLMNGFDSVSVGIYTLIYNLEITVYRVYYGYSKGLLTIVGKKVGTKRYNESKSYGITLMLTDIAFWVLILVISLIFGELILGAFISDKSIVDSSQVYLIMTAFCILPKSLNVILGANIRALGDTKWMLYTQIFGSLLVVMTANIMINILKMGFISIYITLILDETTRCILNLVFYNNRYKKFTVMSNREIAEC